MKSSNKLSARLRKYKRSWEKVKFNYLMHPQTIKQHRAVIAAAEQALVNRAQYEHDTAYLASPDPLVRQGYALKRDVESHFRQKYATTPHWRILIQVPDGGFSPAGYSLFTNLAECLEFLGIPTRILGWDEQTAPVLAEFKPNVLLSSDHASYLARIDWAAIAEYRKQNVLRIGLTASLAEYDNTPLLPRLAWAKAHAIDFFYSFRDALYVQQRAEYAPFFAEGYPMLYLPFSANVLHYYPVAGLTRDLNFVLIASRKREHINFMHQICRRYSGFIDGPGWRHTAGFKMKRDRDRFIYARAIAGLNVHLPEQIDWACEVNERTYQLAACGVPQVIDHPKLLDRIFTPDSIFVAENPAQFTEHLASILKQPELGQRAALLAQQQVFQQHTTFHRAESLITQLNQYFD